MTRDPLADPEPLVERVYSYVAYWIGPGPDAEDVTSETFARAVRHRRQYDPARGKPLSWLLGIARRCLSDFHAQRRPYLEAAIEAASSTDLEGETLERLTLEAALATLSERDAEFISLRHGADLSIRQIAEVVGMNPGAVRVGLHRARARLRAELEQADAAPQPGTAVGFEAAP
jgi:RNA polymerase sigma factor (sigma-70 family)